MCELDQRETERDLLQMCKTSLQNMCKVTLSATNKTLVICVFLTKSKIYEHTGHILIQNLCEIPTEKIKAHKGRMRVL